MSNNNIAQLPSISSQVYKQVSNYRKEALQKEYQQGMYRDGSSTSKSQTPTSSASFLTSSVSPGVGLNKNAQTAASLIGGANSTGASWTGGFGSGLKQAPDVYSPLWLNSNFSLPRDRATMNAWCRSFYALMPYVQNAINLHSTYPISKLHLKCPNKKVEDFFNQMNEDMGLDNSCIEIGQEYWLLGEAFPYLDYDKNQGKWTRIMLQNPDYIVVKRSVVAGEPLIMMRPDDNLRRIVFSNRPSDIQQRAQLNPTIVAHIKRGENIPLDNFYVTHLARRLSSYEVRGCSLLVSCFRDLMLFDMLRENKYVQSSDLINPITLVKVGGEDYRPTPEDLEIWRNTFESAASDKNFKIFTHSGVTVERIGANAGILDINPDIQQLLKEITVGLMVPEVVLSGGGDITYANGGISLDVLRQRYMQFRNLMTDYLRRKVFAPISKIQEFYEYKDGKKQLIVPDVEWNRMSLFDTNDYISNLMQLAGEDRRVSKHTLYHALGLEWEDEQRKIRQEDIRDAIRKKELNSLDRMALNALRSMHEDDEIPEIVEPADPTTSPYTDASGTSPPGGAGGGGGGMGGGLDLGLGPPPGGGMGSAPPPPPPPPPPATPAPAP